MKTENLEVKNITLKEIANGKVFDNEEAVKVAKRILDAKRSSEFNKYRFFYPGANASQTDLLDCLLDFNIFAEYAYIPAIFCYSITVIVAKITQYKRGEPL